MWQGEEEEEGRQGQVKARLIVPEKAEWVMPSGMPGMPGHEPTGVAPCLYPADRPIPEGWLEVEIVSPGFCATKLRDVSRPTMDAGLDLCQCGHDRRSHVEHRNQCLVRRNFEVCECGFFEEGG